MIKSNQISFVLLLSISLLGSCISNKHVVLFQNADLSFDEVSAFDNIDAEYKLQSRDVLAIRIKSIEATAADYLNLEITGSLNNYNGQLSTFMTGFSISDSGYVHIPVLGKIKIGGLTTEEARAYIQRRVDDQLTDATVLINLVSFKISVLGEVRSPGYYHVYNNRGTILDAIALSGGLNDFADRNDVMLIRQKENGSEAIKVDLTDAALLRSPFYYLRPNDALIVKPLAVKHQRSNLANLNIAGVILSGLSTTISIITVIQLLRNP